MAKEIKRVAYVTTLDSANINSWSGTMLWVHDALATAFPEVVRIGPLKSTREPVGVVKRLASWGKQMDHPLWLTQASAKGMARQVESKLSAIQPDAIFCIWHPPIAYLNTDIPIFMLQDSPFEVIQPLYPEMAHLTPAILQEANLVERMAAKRCVGIIQTSEWAAVEARKIWKLPAERVVAIPLGAHIKSGVTLQELGEVLALRPQDTFNLLWLGKDWHRKGGDIAVEAVKILRQRDIPASLRVVGCPVPTTARTPFVEEFGFIDKQSADGASKLDQIMRSSHALILPTAAEAFGIAFVEAAAYAMPSLAPNVMGVGSAILQGVTGALLEVGSTPRDYANQIQTWYENRQAYEHLCQTSLQGYQARFTQPHVGAELRKFMLGRVGF